MSPHGNSESEHRTVGSAGTKGTLLQRELPGHVDAVSPEELGDPAEIFDDAAHFLRQMLCGALHS